MAPMCERAPFPQFPSVPQFLRAAGSTPITRSPMRDRRQGREAE